jgi:transitional endoplasmic reticulum ATPase
VNLGKFNDCYDKAAKAKKAGDLETAKKQYKLAGLALLNLALNADEEIKDIMVERAEEVISYADTLGVDGSIPSKKKDAPSYEPRKKESATKAEKNGDNETEFAPSEVSDMTFDDVAGLQEVKDTIRKRVIYPREHPDVYRKFRVDIGGGVLMYGLPGTGKTMIAKAIASEVGAKFFSIKSSDLLSKWYGEAEKNISALFNQVRKEKVAVIFFDEFDSLSPNRDTGSSGVMSRVVNELLSQIDGFQKSDTLLLLLAATNRPWDIDSAMIRSKRFSVKLYIPLPDFEARKHILKKCFEGIPIDSDIDFDDLSERTEGFNGADVSEFCNRCKDFVLERCIKARDKGLSIEDEIITKNDVYGTLRGFVSSVKAEDAKKIEEFKEKNDVV